MDTNIKTHVDALIDTINNLEYKLDSSDKTIRTLRKRIKDLQKERDSYKATTNAFSEIPIKDSCKMATELQEFIDKKVKAAYKDGYGAALQKVVNLVKEIDGTSNEDTNTDIIDNYLSMYKGNYIFGVENMKETKYNIEEILSYIFQDATPLQIDLWLQKNVTFSRGWSNLFVGINEDLCLKISKIINESQDKYMFIKFGYWLRQI